MRNDIDLRAEFDDFLKDQGFYVLLQRSGRKIRCRCWNEKYQEADSKCPSCFGSGYISRMERHKVRRKTATQIISRPDRSQQTGIGQIWLDAQTIYMRHDAHPKIGDMIYNVGWRGYKPTHLIVAYKINDVMPMQGDNGRIEFWSAAVKSVPLDKDFKDVVVRSIGPIRNYEFIY